MNVNKVLIISDSHGLTGELLEIKVRHHADLMIHCGDSELNTDSNELESFYKVRGNCDRDSRLPDEQLIVLNDASIFIVHGHEHQVKRDLNTLYYTAEEKGANIVCYGHTHVAGAKRIGDKLFINPGSILSPRGLPERTYAILQWETLEQVEVNYYTLSGKPFEQLNYKTSL